MKKLLMILLLVCAWVKAHAQTIVNYVKNGDFEAYSACPTTADQLVYANFWRGAIDSNFLGEAEYFNACSNTLWDHGQHVPDNTGFYQYPHSGNGMVGGHLYYDKTSPAPPPPLPFGYRDYIQGHLYAPLTAGKIYCISFWVNMAEASGYAQNKIGAYLDNGSINTAVDSAGKEITSVTPQVYTNTVIIDTANWTKIEGSFTAAGKETYITIGNFFTNAATSTIVTNYWAVYYQYSYYLIDDVSVIPIDLDADAGKDTWVEQTKKVQIGRVGDTTAIGLDCKWYHKGSLIDSGAIITVKAAATAHITDTYIVVQTICGLVKTDTVLVTTVGLGINTIAYNNSFSVYPNPSNGTIVIASEAKQSESITAKVYDLLGRIIHQQKLIFTNNTASLKIDAPSGTYILELQDSEGNSWRERVVLE